ncbi:MAG: nucleotidyltransferase domain-containing protein [Kofleriaceae bacterium]
MTPGWAELEPRPRAVATAELARRSAERRHLVVQLAGAHGGGYAGARSPIVLDAIHVAPTAALLALAPDDGACEHAVDDDGLTLRYQSHDVGTALRGILRGHGGYLEAMLAARTLVEDARLGGVRPLLDAVTSRLLARHYAGVAVAQRRLLAPTPTAEAVLDALRPALTGAHLLATGELVVDVAALVEATPLDGVDDLAARARADDAAPLAAAEVERWHRDLDSARRRLEEALPTSPLPAVPVPAAVAELDRWLIELRRTAW